MPWIFKTNYRLVVFQLSSIWWNSELHLHKTYGVNMLEQYPKRLIIAALRISQFWIAVARASNFFSSHQGVSDFPTDRKNWVLWRTGHSNSFTIVCHLLLPRLRFHEGTLNLCLHFLGSWVAWKTMHFLPLKEWQFLNCRKCLAKSSQPVHSQTSISCTCKIPSISSYNFATLWAQRYERWDLMGWKHEMQSYLLMALLNTIFMTTKHCNINIGYIILDLNIDSAHQRVW